MNLIRVSILVLLAGAVCQAGLEDFTVVVATKTDTAEFALEDQSLAIKVGSSQGIGRLELRLKKESAKWPETIVLSLRYQDGKPLKELEGFSIAGEKIRINGSRRTSGKMDCREVVPNDPRAPKKNARKVAVTVEKTAKAMKVTVPGKLLAGESGLKIQWIDFYR